LKFSLPSEGSDLLVFLTVRVASMKSFIAVLCCGLAVSALSAESTNEVETAPLRSGGTTSPEPRLTRQRAIQQALAHNPSIIVAREQVEEARVGITIARAIPDPSLVAEVDQEKNFWSPASGSERDIGIQFTVPYPYRTHLNGNIARAGWQAAQHALTALRQQIAAQTSQAYDALLVALLHRNDLSQSREISSQFVQKAEARYRAGTTPKLDILKAKVDLAKAENDLIANERAIATAKAALNRLLGRPLGAALEATDVLEIFSPLPELPVFDELAVRSRPELKGLSALQKAAHDSTILAKQYWAPDLNLTLWRSYIDGSPDSYKFDGGITFPLFFWQHRKGEVAQARHRELELTAAQADLLSQVLLDVRTSYNTATTAWRQAVYLRDQLLPEAHEAFSITFTSYSLGGSSALDLLDAKGTLLDAESQYSDALGSVNDARADLERAVGAPLPTVISGTSNEK
jgi:cobalt-zinc-cadmium efflux system outer membrane protein